MDNAISERNRAVFKDWEMSRRWWTRFFWVWLFMYILGFVVCPFTLDLFLEIVSVFTLKPAAEIVVPMVESYWVLPIVVLAGLLYAVGLERRLDGAP